MILGGFGFHAAKRFLISSSVSSVFRVRLGMSMVIVSPFSSMAIGPASAASGATCPIQGPLVAPENLPSVMRATDSLKPIPAIVAVGMSISGMPGPPKGPS